MSAIWGIIGFNSGKVPEQEKEIMKSSFHKCVIDRYEELSNDNVYLGCGLQYFTKEAEYESLPKQESGHFFTADVVLDNREELCNLLNIAEADTAGLPDGEILFRMYTKYGRDCLNTLLGAYAFVYYDAARKRVDIVNDAVGNRCVYYIVSNDFLYFSSLLAPLQVLMHTKLNERWLTDFLAMDHLFMINEAEETPFTGIYLVPPAHCISVYKNRVVKLKYWKPLDTILETKHKGDKEYKAEFTTMFREVTDSVLRSGAPISILLSGGFDSTAVACQAGAMLRERGEKLYSYTSVPLKEYQVTNDKFFIEDETELVLKTKDFLGNLECTFIDMPGVNAWNNRKKELDAMEIPYKSAQNLLWIHEAMQLAKKNGSRLMLTGSYGNTTISFSGMRTYLQELYNKKRWVKLLKELDDFHDSCGLDKKHVLKLIVKARKESKIIKTDWNSLFRKSFVIREAIAETSADTRMINMQKEFNEAVLSYENIRKLIVHDRALRQIGETETKHSLATGVLLRDPTKDKRIIEFCLKLPLEQFSKHGEDRRLVTQYLKAIMPTHILENKAKGSQSADLSYRLSLDWENIRMDWLKCYQKYNDSDYVDCRRAMEELQSHPDIADYKSYDLVRHIYTILVLEFEDCFKRN